MPVNTHRSGYELAGQLALRRLPVAPIPKEGDAASKGIKPNPNLLKGFIPPQEAR